jgi:hypothetical protein
MIRKIAIYLLFLSTLNGCVQGIAFLGPAFSYSQSGNVIQSALSYGSNQALKKIKAKSIATKKENAFDSNKIIGDDYSFSLVRNIIENESNFKNLANQ